MSAAVWFVRAGRDGIWRERFVSHAAIYIGYGLMTLASHPTDEELRSLLVAADPTKNVPRRLSQIKLFLYDMAVGDMVLSDLYDGRLAYGEIASHWRINESETRGRIYREVRWLGSASRNEFPAKTIARINAPGTVKRLTEDDISTVRGLERTVDAIAYREGRSVSVLVTAKERDPAARAACLAHYGPRCVVCGFASRTIFPGIERDLIHVHHLDPIANADGERAVDPIADLRPLCPTCHAAAHARNPPFSLDELRNMRVTP